MPTGFAVISATEFYSILTIFAGMLLGFYAVAKLMLKQATKDREADREERKDLSSAIKLMAENSAKVARVTEAGMDKVAVATNKTAREAKERNGHLAELIIQQGEMVQEVAKHTTQNIIEGVTNIETQKVHTQVVDQSTVNKGGK